MLRRGFVRSRLAGRFFVAAALALLLCMVGSASAGTGGLPSPGGGPPPPGGPGGSPAESPSAGVLTLTSASTGPRKAFYFGVHYPRLKYTISSTEAQNDLRIDVVNAAGEVVMTFYREDVAPETEDTVRWDGSTSEGRPAHNGRYSFRVGPQTAAPVARKATGSTVSLGFSFYGYAFPVLGRHEMNLDAGRFGAGRSGHTHQGQDVTSPCGTPLVAVRGGRVQFAGFQGAAGNYVVIDGRGTGYDFMYAHLAEPSPLHSGDPVRTGQPIGIVGETGDAVGCHLHFEMWTAPGWYEGGSPIDPLPYLERWDRYS